MDVLTLAKWLAFLCIFSIIILVVYIFWKDRRLTTIPPSALLTVRLLPWDRTHCQQTGRRYIVVGGGFLGGWIVTKLLEHGESLLNIRILDINPSSNYVVTNAILEGLEFIRVDITDSVAVEAAFESPWPQSGNISVGQDKPATTVFHTAASIRFFERSPVFFDRSTKVNVHGTQNIINAARKVGADVMVYSSGSVSLHSLRLLLWPWGKTPEQLVQIANDDDNQLPKRHDFFSNYAASKLRGESIVRLADKLPTGDARLDKVIRTGCVRPGNGVFGPRGDTNNCGAWLTRQYNPTIWKSTVHSFCYIENCTNAHLCYEARFIELQQAGSTNPDIGGQAFTVADSGPPPTYSDVYTIMETLTDRQCTFYHLSPTLMLILAHLIEWYYLIQQSLVRQGSRSAALVPPLNDNLIRLQPFLFSLVMVHLIYDDSRARLPPQEGGLGYTGRWTSAEGLYRTVEEYRSDVLRSDGRSETAGIFTRIWRKKAVTMNE